MESRMTEWPARRATVWAAGLLSLASIGAGEGPPPITTPPVASGNLPAALPGEPRAPLFNPTRPAPALGEGFGTPLIPGQSIEPIDLAGALRLAGARDLDIALARERACQAVAELDQARVLWLPSLYVGPSWVRHDGQAQIVQGQVQSISKSSLFIGANAAAGSSAFGPNPAGGPAPLSGLATVLRISDAIFEPMSARRIVAARKAGILTATNDALLGVSEAYFDLQQAAGTLAIAREAAANAGALASLTATFARSGAGLEADHRRILAERERQRRNVEVTIGQLEVASAELVRRIRIDPRVVVSPVEPPEAAIRMVGDDCPLDDLIETGLRNRPELAEAQETVQATLVRLRQAKLRPLIPSLSLQYAGGGFGGGVNEFFGNFGARSDAAVNLYWEVQNLGMADRAIARSRGAQQRAALLEQMKVQDRVAAEVVRADKSLLASARAMREAGKSVPEALSSLDLNLTNIRRGAGLPGATRPIEVLQPIQALAQARADYLDAVLAYNRAQFRLYHALGRPPQPDASSNSTPTPPDPLPARPGRDAG
jgi:outer membrane protein TolC